MQTQKLYDEYMITSMVPGFDPVEIESSQGTRIRGSEFAELAANGTPLPIRATKCA